MRRSEIENTFSLSIPCLCWKVGSIKAPCMFLTNKTHSEPTPIYSCLKYTRCGKGYHAVRIIHRAIRSCHWRSQSTISFMPCWYTYTAFHVYHHKVYIRVKYLGRYRVPGAAVEKVDCIVCNLKYSYNIHIDPIFKIQT